ncbi:MAG: phage integrase SAM-like domain-containing protein, partial [Dysgonamonadaceae bacterium]|nr:phage integrase SAM-like domain-containing protein [Dysgonamonadaceae bacterium]
MHTQKIHSHAYCSCGQRHRSGYDRLLLSDLAEIIVRELEKHRQRSTAKVCQSAVNSLHRFTGNENLPLKDISPDLMQRYEDYLANENLKRNTISCYMRNLRALLNKATSRKLIPPPPENPFVQVYTGTCHTRKRALSKDEICRLSALGSENALSPAL